MKSFYLIVLLCLAMFSCNKICKEENKSIIKQQAIKNKEFEKVIKNFIINSPIEDPDSLNNILIYFYTENKDTVLDLVNRPIHDCKNLVDTIHYENRRLFLFTTTDLKKKLTDYIILSNKKISINCEELIDTSSVYLSYQESFILNNGLLNQK